MVSDFTLPEHPAVAVSHPPCAPRAEPDNTETTRYVGQNSIPALLREQTSANEPQEVSGIRQDMRSLLGLDNSAPFPLMSSRHLDRLTLDISSELPSDREVMKWVLFDSESGRSGRGDG